MPCLYPVRHSIVNLFGQKPMSTERLLERISNLDLNPEVRTERDLKQVINSINNHLMCILNTRQGSALIADDFGMPDITNVPGEALTETITRIEEAIQKVAVKYEQRLSKIKIVFESSDKNEQSFRFKLEGFLKDDTSIPIAIETLLTSEGKFNFVE